MSVEESNAGIDILYTFIRTAQSRKCYLVSNAYAHLHAKNGLTLQ